MPPTPDPDVVVDLAGAATGSVDDGRRPAGSARDTYSWNLEGDVLRDLLLRAG